MAQAVYNPEMIAKIDADPSLTPEQKYQLKKRFGYANPLGEIAGVPSPKLYNDPMGWLAAQIEGKTRPTFLTEMLRGMGPNEGAPTPNLAAGAVARTVGRGAKGAAKKSAEEVVNALDKALGVEAPPLVEAVKKGTRRIRASNPAVKAEVEAFSKAMGGMEPPVPPPSLPIPKPAAAPVLPTVPNSPNPRLAEIERALAETGDRPRVPLKDLGVDTQGQRYGMAPWVNPQAAGMNAGEDVVNALRRGSGTDSVLGPVRSTPTPSMQQFAANRYGQATGGASPVEQAIAGSNSPDAFRRALMAKAAKVAGTTSAVGLGLGAGLGALNYATSGEGNAPQGTGGGGGAMPPSGRPPLSTQDNQLARDEMSAIGLLGSSGLPSPQPPMGSVPPGFQQTVARILAAQQAQRARQQPPPQAPQMPSDLPQTEGMTQGLLDAMKAEGYNPLQTMPFTQNARPINSLLGGGQNVDPNIRKRNALLRALVGMGKGLGRVF